MLRTRMICTRLPLWNSVTEHESPVQNVLGRNNPPLIATLDPRITNSNSLARQDPGRQEWRVPK